MCIQRRTKVCVDSILWKTWDMRQAYLVSLIGLLLAGCAADPQLEARPGGNPMQVDLSGQWTLRGGLVRPTQVEPTIRIPPPTNRTMQSGGRSVSGRSRAKGSSVYVFMESGKDLKVTQTTYGLFFSFDGIDGVGKSTQVGLFCCWLSELGHDVVACRDPAGGELCTQDPRSRSDPAGSGLHDSRDAGAGADL